MDDSSSLGEPSVFTIATVLARATTFCCDSETGRSVMWLDGNAGSDAMAKLIQPRMERSQSCGDCPSAHGPHAMPARWPSAPSGTGTLEVADDESVPPRPRKLFFPRMDERAQRELAKRIVPENGPRPYLYLTYEMETAAVISYAFRRVPVEDSRRSTESCQLQ